MNSPEMLLKTNARTAAFFDLDGTLVTVNTGKLWMDRERRLKRIKAPDVIMPPAATQIPPPMATSNSPILTIADGAKPPA